ncbi:hypothetical protein UCRPC4_g06735 [Phaeomoniella chlamydospora]|uniref:Uncharacterized protein n=1 Tax=Phaeomoniella chlamydospora TaxID=158046 RepID=A0A0G2GBB8_PHACM|nr:hypothetical protein UCRPC4_g06735 [Phaeomoniella chlamydospora]
MQKKKAERKTRDRVLSAAHAKHPQMRPAIGRGTGGSPSRRSVQQGLANISDKIRQFSFSVSSGHSDDVKDPRRGSRQRAIPLSPYQKHGPSIWDETMRRDKHKKRLREDRQRAMLGHSGNVSRENEKAGKDDRDKLVDKHKRKSAPLPLLSNFHNGQNQLVHVLGDARKRLKRNDSEKRREALKKSIRLIGQADQFSDGRVNHWI